MRTLPSLCPEARNESVLGKSTVEGARDDVNCTEACLNDPTSQILMTLLAVAT